MWYACYDNIAIGFDDDKNNKAIVIIIKVKKYWSYQKSEAKKV